MISMTRYDYRAKWMEFTRRLGSCVSLDELAPTLVDAVVETLAATGAVLYLTNPGDSGLRAAAWCWVTNARVFTEGSAIVSLRWREEAIGALVIGEPGGEPYTRDDLGLMEAIGEHAAGLIATVRRFTSFVARDLGHSIAALSALSESAPQRADDREFRRDALDTVARTVTRMRSPLGRLREAPHGGRT